MSARMTAATLIDDAVSDRGGPAALVKRLTLSAPI